MAALAYMERLRVVSEPPAEYAAPTGAPTFSALPHAVLFDTALSPGARLTYAVLQAHWWQGGECWASHATLAGQIGCKERMLRYYLRELIGAGYISERRRGHGQAKAYAPIQAAIDCQLNRQENAGSEPKRQPVASQAATGCQFKRQPVAIRRRRNEEDSPKEEDTGVSGDAHAAPAPARPKTERRAVRLADDWGMTDAHYEAAARAGFDRARADHEGQKFADHHRAKGSRMVDWLAAWRTWMRNAVEFDARNGYRRNGSAPVGSSAPPRRKISEDARRAAAEWESL